MKIQHQIVILIAMALISACGVESNPTIDQDVPDTSSKAQENNKPVFEKSITTEKLTTIETTLPPVEGSIEADFIELIGKGSDDGNGDNTGGETGGFRDNSAFCAEGKQVKPHPLAPKIAKQYGVTEKSVTEKWVMGRYCEGYSIGEIMLAIRTSQREGKTTPDDILVMREAGNGWGEIWKDLGLIGSEKSGQIPPGLLKKQDHAVSKNK